jgi:subtilisin family serine protease
MVMSSRVRRFVCLLLLASLTLPAHAADNRFIVRIKSGLDGLSVIKLVCSLVGCTVDRTLDGDASGAQVQQGSLFLVSSVLGLDLGDLLSFTLRLLGVASAEPDLPLPLFAGTDSSAPAVDDRSDAFTDYLYRREPASYYGTTVTRGYLEQPAVGIVRLRDAQCAYGTSGAGLVAIIDTGIDPTHPALASVVQPGYDFTRNVAGGDETADFKSAQESAALLDADQKPFLVNQESAALLDQESAALLDKDKDKYKAFGHGTMVAGVVHLVAPTAKILPLKAFSSDGSAYLSDILRAINFAVQKKAKVINMSFSRPTASAELKRALDQAAAYGVIAVSSAGNEGVKALRWPAALDNVVGVASTSNGDARSGFSNYGSSLVWVAAPGEGIITTYPMGHYAAVWGTSFSTPFAAGTTALFAGMKTTLSQSEAAWALSQAKWVSSDLGYGRLDIYKAVRAGRLAWPSLSGAFVSTCGAQ